MSNRATVLEVIRQLLEDKGLPTTIGDDTVAIGEDGLGLDSLDIATIVAELEESLDIDPFARDEVRIGSIGDFIALYEPDA